jgi:ATP phosphoribosyltransferase
MLKLAIQKSGRLKDDSIALLKECGIKIDNRRNQLKVTANNFPLEILFLRNSDIPGFIENGNVDIGVSGENLLYEKSPNVSEVLKLGFASCRLSIAVPNLMEYNSVQDLAGKNIATSYPNSLKKFLSSNGVEAKISQISGSVEIAPGMGLADAVCDLVSSGNTLFTNGLKEVELILKSQSVLISSPSLSPDKQLILDQLVFRINSVLDAKNKNYILLNCPNEKIEEISNLLPGMRSPSVLPLQQEGWSSLHSVIEETAFWESISQLRNAGAEGILIIPIKKMIL